MALLVAAALVTAANVASATTFTYSGYNVTNEQDISILSPTTVSGGVGQIELIGSGANVGEDILAWCLDIYDYLNPAGTYQIGTLTTAGSGNGNPTLTSTQIGEIGALIANGDALINTSYNVSAAIQLALWEVEYGKSFEFTGLSSAVILLADTYLTDVENGTWAADYNVSLLSGSGNQNLAFLDPTPVPSTWMLLLTGLAGLGFFVFRRAKNRSAAVAAG